MGTKSPRPFTDAETQIIIEGVLRGDPYRKILKSLPVRCGNVLRVKVHSLRKSGRLPPAPEKKTPRSYTEAEDAVLIEGRQAELPYKRIAAMLPGRSVQSLQQRWVLLTNKESKPRRKYKTVSNPEEAGKPKSDRAVEALRRCLGCGKDFLSTWIGNRSCASCRQHKRDYAPYMYELRL